MLTTSHQYIQTVKFPDANTYSTGDSNKPNLSYSSATATANMLPCCKAIATREIEEISLPCDRHRYCEDEEDLNLTIAAKCGDTNYLTEYFKEKPFIMHKLHEPIIIRGDDTDKTLVHHAIAGKQLSMLQYLVEQGAKLNNITPNPILLCCEQLGYNYSDSPLKSVELEKRKNLLDIMHYLLSQGVNPNGLEKTLYDTITPLTMCMDRNALDAFSLLLAHGADVNFPKADSKIAQSYAKNHVKHLELALKRGLNINTVYDNGLQIIHIMCLEATVKHIKLLHDYDVDMNSKPSKLGATPLHYALSLPSKDEAIDKAKLLLIYGANPNILGCISLKEHLDANMNYPTIEELNKTRTTYTPDCVIKDLEVKKIFESYKRDYQLEQDYYNKIEKSITQLKQDTTKNINRQEACNKLEKADKIATKESEAKIPIEKTQDNNDKTIETASFYERLKTFFCSGQITYTTIPTQEVTSMQNVVAINDDSDDYFNTKLIHDT